MSSHACRTSSQRTQTDPLMRSASAPPPNGAAGPLFAPSLRSAPAPAPHIPTDAYRAIRHQEAREFGESLAQPQGPIGGSDDRTLVMLHSALCRFVATLGVGARFFAIDFTEHCSQHGLIDEHFEMRRTSGLFADLIKSGVLTHDGYAPNGGGTRSNSTPRRRYRVTRLPDGYSPLGAPDQSSPTPTPHPQEPRA